MKLNGYLIKTNVQSVDYLIEVFIVSNALIISANNVIISDLVKMYVQIIIILFKEAFVRHVQNVIKSKWDGVVVVVFIIFAISVHDILCYFYFISKIQTQ